MQETLEFKPGDVVIHPRRPEWGEGTVDQAATIVHEGHRAQRLVVCFSNYGRVTINTGIAPLMPPDRAHAGHDPMPGGNGKGWLSSINNAHPHGELWKLPDALTDPFESLARRLAATLATFRFHVDPRNSSSQRVILEWAMAQTGLPDPLAKYTRHELELAFPRYVRDRDNHLLELVRTIKRQGRRDVLEEALREARTPAARSALDKAMRA